MLILIAKGPTMPKIQPPSDRRLAANRANAQLSTGPRTPEGKAASSQNACKHGILARHTLFAKEDPQELEEFRTVFYDKFQPADDYESSLVDLMIDAKWRIARLHRIESAEFDRQLSEYRNAERAGLMLYSSESCERRSRYESRLLRNHATVLSELQKHQAKREARAKSANAAKSSFRTVTATERTASQAQVPSVTPATPAPIRTNPISAPPPPQIRPQQPQNAA